MTEERTVTEFEAKEILLAFHDYENDFIGFHYLRKEPKCLKCERKYKDRETAPKICSYKVREQVGTTASGRRKFADTDEDCLGEVSFETNDVGRFSVQNPGQGITKPGEGVRKGKSFYEALEQDNCVKYYSTQRSDRTDDKKGAYRQFGLDMLIDFTARGVKYNLKR